MQVKTEVKEFEPFDITITVESKEEAVKLFVLFCHNKLLNQLDLQIESDLIRTALKERVEITYPDYAPLFNKVDSIIKKES